MNETSQSQSGRKMQRRTLIALAALVTLVALFYLEEDWRGKRAWESFKRDAEARGLVLDWDKLAPTPVPDDQNFFTASTNIAVRFTKPQGDAENKLFNENSWLRIVYETNSWPVFDNTKASPRLVAVIKISPADGADSGSNSLVVQFNGPGAPGRLRDLIQKTMGRSAYGTVGFRFSELQLSNLATAQILLKTETPPDLPSLENIVPPDLDTNLGRLRLEAAADQNTFRVLLTDVHVTAAADYLKWSDQFVPALDEVREALKRPYALLPGDYSQPVLIPVPSFITLRAVAQTLAQRAQCDFLLDRPDEALREMTLMHDVCRILKRPPAGKPITLVESMINVAIAGLYADTVADGLRLHAWKEPQLAALQQQLREDDLLSLVADSLHCENAASCFEMLNPTLELKKALWGDCSLWQRLKDPAYLFLNYAPRGWLYQNAVDHVAVMQRCLQAYDSSNQMILSEAISDYWQKHADALNRWNPYSFLEAFYFPNMSKATQRTAYNQTYVNEALMACALERYHLAHGEYPEKLDALVPQFMEELPHDIIGGQPLHYRRMADGKFLLYSVGWNEKDDGGVAGTASDMAKGDWVWKN